MSKHLPVGWTAARVGDLGTWVGGGTPSKARADYWVGGTIPWVSPKDMKTPLVRSTEDQITAAAIAGSSTAVVEAHSVLLVVRSGILKHSLPVAINAVPVTLNQDLKALRPTDAVVSEYVAWLLRRFEQDILRTCTKAGTTVQSVEMPQFLEFVVPVPPLTEQRRIVAAIEEHLSRFDAAVAALKRVQALMPRYRASVLKAACGGALVSRSGPWGTATIGDMAERVEYGTSARADLDGDVPVLRMGNIVEGELDVTMLKFLPPTHREFPRLFLASGDVLFNRTNSAELVGKSAVYRGAPSPCSFASYLIRVRLTERCNPAYAAIVINSAYGRDWIASVVSQQVGQANVSGSKLKTLAIPLPSRDEQDRIVAEAERRSTLSAAVSKEVDVALTRAARLRQSILKRAFEGKLVPQDPSDEPASVLLDRIRASRTSAPCKPKKARRRA